MCKTQISCENDVDFVGRGILQHLSSLAEDLDPSILTKVLAQMTAEAGGVTVKVDLCSSCCGGRFRRTLLGYGR